MGTHYGSRPGGNSIYVYVPPPPPYTTSGLQLFFDAGTSSSYPGTGTVVTDISGNSNSGDLINGTGYSSSDGGYFTFDGSNDTIDINNTISLPTDFSVETWFYLTSTATNYRILFNVGNFQIRFGDGGFGNRLQFGVNMSTIAGCFNINLSKTAALNNWRHILWTRESGVNKMYLAGIQENLAQGTGGTYNLASFTNSTSVTMTGGSTFWGASGNFFIGRMSALRIYNRALSQAEITTNYDHLKSRYGF
jgi:hypothetical protein